MKPHPATQYKRKYNDIVIKDPANLSTSQPVGIIGRRTGQLFVDDNETDYDFLLKDNLPLRPPTIGKEAEKYLSDSSSSESNSSLDDSSSQAEVSGDEEEESKEIKQINIEDIKKTIIQAEEDMFPLEKEDEPKKEPIRGAVDNQMIPSSPAHKYFKTKEEIENERIAAQKRFEALSTIKKPNRNDMSAIDDNVLLLDELNKAKKRVSINTNNSSKSKANNTVDTIQLDDDLSFINKPTSPNSSLTDINTKANKGIKKEKGTKKKKHVNKTIPEEEPEKEEETQEVVMNSNKNQKSTQSKALKNKNRKEEEEHEDDDADVELKEKERLAQKKKEELKSIEKLNKEMEKKKQEEKEEKERKEKKRQDKLAKEKEEKKRKQEQLAKEKEEKKAKEKKEREAKEKEAKEREEKKRKQDQLAKDKEKMRLEQWAKEKEEKKQRDQLAKEEEVKSKKNKLSKENKEKEELKQREEDKPLRDISILNDQPKDDDAVKKDHKQNRFDNDASDDSDESIQLPSKRISLTKSKIIYDENGDNSNNLQDNVIESFNVISNSDLPLEKVNTSIQSIKRNNKEEKSKQIPSFNEPKAEEKKDKVNRKQSPKKKIKEENKKRKESEEDDDDDDDDDADNEEEDKNKKLRKKSPSKRRKSKSKKERPKRLQEDIDREEEDNQNQPRKIKSKRIVTQSEYEKISYSKLAESQPKVFDVIHPDEEKTFGKNGRYSLRMRIPRLNKLLGEKVTYIHTEDGDEIRSIYSSRKAVKSITEQYEIGRPKQRKLRKGLREIKEEYSNNNSPSPKKHNNKEEQEEEEDELNDSYSEIDEDNNVKLLVIKPHSQKSLSKNYQTELLFRIRESSGRNSIIINDKEYRNLKKNSSVNVPPNCEFQIKNYSKKNFVVAMCFLEDSDG